MACPHNSLMDSVSVSEGQTITTTRRSHSWQGTAPSMARAEGRDGLQILLVSTNGLMNFNWLAHCIYSGTALCGFHCLTMHVIIYPYSTVPLTLAILSSPEAYKNTLPLIPTVEEGAKSSLLAAFIQLQDSSLVACGTRVPAIAQRTTQLQYCKLTGQNGVLSRIL